MALHAQTDPSAVTSMPPPQLSTFQLRPPHTTPVTVVPVRSAWQSVLACAPAQVTPVVLPEPASVIETYVGAVRLLRYVVHAVHWVVGVTFCVKDCE